MEARYNRRKISKIDRPSISAFVNCFQITLFTLASLVSWVYLWHLFERLPLLESIATDLMTSPIDPSVFYWMHQLTLVAKYLKIHIQIILDWFTMYVLLIIYSCQTFKSCFLFQYSSNSLLECISLDHSCQIWQLKLYL